MRPLLPTVFGLILAEMVSGPPLADIGPRLTVAFASSFSTCIRMSSFYIIAMILS